MPMVRLVNTDGTQVGVVPIEEARQKARDAGLDLVEVSPESQPPVCRVLDYGKFRYGSHRKEHKSAPTRKQHFGQIKEIRVRPKIDRHDLARKLDHGRELLEDGYRLQLTCVFRGREMTHQELGRNLLHQAVQDLAAVSRLERDIVSEGRRMNLMLMPKVDIVRAKAREREQATRTRLEMQQADAARKHKGRAPRAGRPAAEVAAPATAEGTAVGPAGADRPFGERLEFPAPPPPAAGPDQEADHAQAEDPQGTGPAN